MKELSKKIGEMDFDGLITDIIPPVQVRGGTIAAPGSETTYKRGTLLSKSTADGKLYILGSAPGSGDTLTPDCVLCDDTELDNADADVAVYTAGCFDQEKVTVADSYTVSETDKDKLRERGIVFKAASAAN